MTGLGNVFDAAEGDEETPRGPDLEIDVEVPRSALGREGGYEVEVAPQLPVDAAGALVTRHVAPGDPDDRLRLHLSAAIPDKARLRLRGAGGVVEGGRPGDLFVTVTVVDDPPRRIALGQGGWPWWLVLAAIVVVAIVAATR